LAAKERLKSRILRLLKEDEEFRYAVAGLIGLEEILKRLDRNEKEMARLREDMIKGFERHDREIQRLTEEMNRLREDMIKGFERHDVELAKLREDMIKGFERYDAELAKLREDMIKGFERHDMEILRLTEEMNRLREDMVKGFERHDMEIAKLREDMNKGFERYDRIIASLREDMIKGFERHDREIERLREDMVKGFERHDRELARLREDMMKGFETMNRRISALGARWGLESEGAFREGLRGILEKELGLKVERWTAFDEAGLVFGHPSQIEVDVAVRDGKVMLIEVSSHVKHADVTELVRKAELYERRTGRRPDRLIMVTPFAEEGAMEAALKLGVEIYTRV
jgi:hypothetical protein